MRFSAADGLREAGHEVEILDLHGVGFDPVFKTEDYLQFVVETLLPDIAILRNQLVTASGGPIRRFLARILVSLANPD